MRIFTLLMLVVLVIPAQAMTNVDVFSAEILLDQEDSDAEQKARSEGLEQVIIKVSGDKNAVKNEVIQKAVKRSAASYLSQIGYGEQAGNQTLRMVFNPPQIQSLLSQAQLPFWSDEREALIVWIVEEGRYGRDILWENSNSPFVNQLRYFSSLRGLPVLVPVGDFEDVTAISPTDIWGGFLDPLSVASTRYPVEAVLVMRVQNQGSRDHIRWTLYDSKPDKLAVSTVQPLSGTESGQSAKALEAVVDQVTSYFAQKSSINLTSESSGSIPVEFSGIDDATTFFTMEKKLKKLRSVAAVYIEEITGDTIRFNVLLLSSEADFENEVLQTFSVSKSDPEFVENAPELEVNSSDVIRQEIQDSSSESPSLMVDTQEEISVVPSASGNEDIQNPESASDTVATEESREGAQLENVIKFEWIN